MTEFGLSLLISNTIATWFLVGLIWFVQVVHYPSFVDVGDDDFRKYHAVHVRRTTNVVVLPMIVEAVTAAGLAAFPPWPAATVLCRIGLLLVGLIWASTALVQVPCHRCFETGFDATVASRLVSTNWLRTTLWSIRGVISAWLIFGAIKVAG